MAQSPELRIIYRYPGAQLGIFEDWGLVHVKSRTRTSFTSGIRAWYTVLSDLGWAHSQGDLLGDRGTATSLFVATTSSLRSLEGSCGKAQCFLLEFISSVRIFLSHER